MINIYTNGTKRFPKLYNIVKILMIALLIGFLFEFFGAKGIFGFISLLLLIGLYKLYLFRDNYIQTMESIEAKMFGKPLNKEYWKPKELKKTRVKIKWEKKKK